MKFKVGDRVKIICPHENISKTRQFKITRVNNRASAEPYLIEGENYQMWKRSDQLKLIQNKINPNFIKYVKKEKSIKTPSFEYISKLSNKWRRR